ncbi:MAG: hypothetical protein A2171_01770 [Candidatus Levybacteria bacterium RBG_13_35_9]|nr:MAG: hypothetical protein A2171_01770 [Candidatus Levybacteria bacterium RBG_13_35_9]
MNIFAPKQFLNVSGFALSDIFEEIPVVWEAISKIEKFVKLSLSKKLPKRNVFVGKGTVVEKGAFVKGPAIIGKNCFIAHGAYIRENVIIGDNVKIGHACEIKNSIILNNTHIAHFNYIGDSVIGNNVNFGAGAITANFRLDGKNVFVRNNSLKIDSKLLKFGAIVGDGTKIGVGAVLNPGTVLGKNCVVYPLINVFGLYTDNKVIKK